MTIIAHVALSLAYASATVFFAFALYQASADPALSIVAGTLVALAMGFTHTAAFCRRREQELRSRLTEMQQAHEETRSELAEVRESQKKLDGAVQEALTQPRHMAKELYVIVQSLQGQLAQKRQLETSETTHSNPCAPAILSKANGHQHALVAVEESPSEADEETATKIKDALENNRLESFFNPLSASPSVRRRTLKRTRACAPLKGK